MEQKWSNLAKSFRVEAHFAAGHRCEPLEVLTISGEFLGKGAKIRPALNIG
jgi:hypothetical protein